MSSAPDITLDQVRPVVAALEGGHEAVALIPLAGGSSKVWRVDRAGAEPVVLKTYADGVPWTPGKEALAAGLVTGLHVPVTRYLAMDETKAQLPVRFAITNHLAGRPVRAFIGEPGVEEVYREMGAAMRQLHAVRMEAYGYLGARGLVQPRATNAESMAERVEEAVPRFVAYGGDPGLARRLKEIVAAHVSLFRHSVGPRFAHDDLQQGNVLAARGEDGQLRLTGLIDFGNARAADPVSDLAKNLFCAAHEDPRSTAPMLEGYGEIPHPEPEAALWLYTLVHRMTMWWWLRHIGVIAEGAHNALMDDLTEMAEAGGPG